MKIRLAILTVIALVGSACASDDANANPGLLRSTTSLAPTTTVAEPGSTDGGGSETTPSGSVPTNPDPIDSGSPNPEVEIPPYEVEPCEAPTEDLEGFCQPFELVLGNTRIVWDRYFWGQGTFSRGSVEVFHGDELVAAGPVAGEGAVYEEDEDGNLVFYNPIGTVVAIVGPDDLFPAQDAAVKAITASS